MKFIINLFLVFSLLFASQLNAGWIKDAVKATAVVGAVKAYKIAKEKKLINRTKPTKHSVQQKINRNVSSKDELDALRNPLQTKQTKYDNFGRPSQRFIGEKAEVAINPETNKIISVNPTSTKKAEKLKKAKQ
ncbi:MAG: hypothetical protein QG567_2140 [Campylobacterota bacterium]|nr:hypothetical protein [Campylobacterota bacterium]